MLEGVRVTRSAPCTACLASRAHVTAVRPASRFFKHARSRSVCAPQAGKWNWGPLEWARASDEKDVDEAYRQQQEVLKRRR
ncbi:hypothetical protein WJX84_000867, partial [Apatococcus fuscideae]